MELEVDASAGLARITLKGELNADDFVRGFEAMIDHPDFRGGMNSLWDLRDASIARLSGSDVRRIVQVVEDNKERRGSGKVAIIAVGDVDFGLSRMFEMLAEGLPTRVMSFRDAAGAEAWLTDDPSSREDE